MYISLFIYIFTRDAFLSKFSVAQRVGKSDNEPLLTCKIKGPVLRRGVFTYSFQTNHLVFTVDFSFFLFFIFLFIFSSFFFLFIFLFFYFHLFIFFFSSSILP